MTAPRVDNGDPLVDADFGRLPWRMPNGDPIPAWGGEDDSTDWGWVGHKVFGYALVFLIGFLCGIAFVKGLS